MNLEESRRKKIVEFQAALEQGPCLSDDQVDKVLPVKHYFANGQYAREMAIPRGVILVGKIHKHEHLNFITKGEVSFLSEFEPMRIKAPYTFASPAGTKRIIFAHEDTLWTTIHNTEKTDLDEIEKEVIAESYLEIGMDEPMPETEMIEAIKKALEGGLKCLG